MHGTSARVRAIALVFAVTAPLLVAQVPAAAAPTPVPAVQARPGLAPVPRASTPAPPAPADTASLVVGLRPDIDGAALVSRLHTTVVNSRPVDGLSALTLEVPTREQAAVLAGLASDPGVRYAEPNSVAHGMGVVTPNDPFRDWDQWSFKVNRVAQAWSWTTGSSEVVVAVVDSGVTPHEDLDDGRVLAGRDFVNDDDDPGDDHGHGTFVAGMIAGEANNGLGGAGVCWQCRILPVKVLERSDSGGTSGTYADVAAGIVWAADRGADIINVSLAGRTDSQVLREAVAHASARGALIVAAAGDRKSTDPTYPASIEPVIAVGGTDNLGDPQERSNTNPADAPWIDLAAHGNRFGLDHEGKRVQYSGSSLASPLVSGAAALILALRPSATVSDLRETLIRQSSAGRTSWGGVPALNVAKATKASGPPDTQPPIVENIGLPTDGTVVCGCYRRLEPTISENRDITRLDVVVAGKVVASDSMWPPALAWAPKDLTGPTAVTIRAHDSSGNVGVATGTVNFDTTLSASIVKPAPYEVVDGLTKVVISGDPDITGILVNDGKVVDTSSGSPWTTTVDFSSQPTGKWSQVVASITDRAGNESRIQQWVGIDHDIPVVTFDDAEFPDIFRGPVTFTPSVTDSSLVQITLLLDGKAVAATDWNALVLPWPGAAQLTGTHTLTFRAVDEAGHTSEVTRTARFDNTGPKVGRVHPANKAVVRGTFTATASGVTDTSGVVQVDLYVNGSYVGSDNTAPYSVPVKTAGKNGKLTLTWEVFDKVGNRTTIVRTVTADNKPPTVSISKGPGTKAKVKGTVKVAVSAKDASGVARVQLLINGKVVATDDKVPYSFKVNTGKQKKAMKVRVRAYDKAGNMSLTAPRTWYRR